MTDEPTPTCVLVVANETLAGDELIEAVRRRAAQGPIRVVVVAPVSARSSPSVASASRRSEACSTTSRSPP